MSGSNFLEGDNLMEKQLRFVKDEFEENFNQYFGDTGALSNKFVAPPRDYKVVQPKPGFCIKSFKTNSNEKYFINICQTDEIPAPEDISEAQLTAILNSDEPSSFRIPMSISEPRITHDKSNNPVDVVDIAIHPKFFFKIEKVLLFRDFFLALIAEALSDKYNVQIKIDKAIILNNRKFIGTLVSHRVRNKDVKTVLNSYKKLTSDEQEKLKSLGDSKPPLIEEIDYKHAQLLQEKARSMKQASQQKNKIKEVSTPDYKLIGRKRNDAIEEIQAEFYLPKCTTSEEIILDIGEDRIVVESPKHGYLFDKFLNYHLNCEHARAIFDKTQKMLQIRVPVQLA